MKVKNNILFSFTKFAFQILAFKKSITQTKLTYETHSIHSKHNNSFDVPKSVLPSNNGTFPIAIRFTWFSPSILSSSLTLWYPLQPLVVPSSLNQYCSCNDCNYSTYQVLTYTVLRSSILEVVQGKHHFTRRSTSTVSMGTSNTLMVETFHWKVCHSFIHSVPGYVSMGKLHLY